MPCPQVQSVGCVLRDPPVALDQVDRVALRTAQGQRRCPHPSGAPPGSGGSLASSQANCCRLWTPDAAAHKSLFMCLHVVQPSFPPGVLVLLLILLHMWAFCSPTPGKCQEAGSFFMHPPLLFRAPSKHLTGFILM